MDAAHEFATQVARLDERIQAVILFGSRARGTASPDSDIDVVVIVDRRDAGLVDAIQGVALEIDLLRLTTLSVKICPMAAVTRMEDVGDPFWAAVQAEGRVLWTRTSRVGSATGSSGPGAS